VTDEVRSVSFLADASQYIREMTKIERKLLDHNRLLGQTDGSLRKSERAMNSAAESARRGAEAMSRMKAGYQQLEAENKKMTAAVEKSNKAAQKQAADMLRAANAIAQYKAEAKQMQAANKQLTKDKEALVGKVEKLENALKGVRADFKAFKENTKAAENGILQFGAGAAKTITNLQKLETQFDALRGAQLQALSVPGVLGRNANGTLVNAAGFIRNPDVSALQRMGTAQLAEINRAYDIMGQTLQQQVQRELSGRMAAEGFKITGEQLEFSNALRYQLYDLVGIFGTVGVAATGLSVAFLNVGIQWEKNFANVIRTSQVTGGAVEALRQDFLDLQSAIPVTSEDLAKIGTLGAQMGVAASDLAYFTEVVAQFSATSGLSVDEAATALSRLDELLPDVEGNYVRLASAILKTGVNAVATEQQIVRGTNQIASMGQIAGMTTPEVVALASAMSSLGFSPELQRSIVTSSFSKIMLATTEVSDKTAEYGRVLGMTGKQFQEAWRSDALGTYRNLLVEIANRGDAVAILDDLGLASQRLTPNLLKLGQNANVLDEALRDTSVGWREQTELTRQYEIISRTVAARLQTLGQTWEALLVTLNDSEGIFGWIIDRLTDMLNGLRQIAKSPVASTIITLVTALGLLGGALAIVLSGVALFTAGYIAMVNATVGLNTVLATHDAALGKNTAALSINTTETQKNAAAKLGLGAPLALATTATDNNTRSQLENNKSLREGAIGAVRFSSGLLGMLPRLLTWGSYIGLATIAIGGLVSAAQQVGPAALDFDKWVRGIDTPEKSINDAIAKIKEADAQIADEVANSKELKEAAEQRGSNFWDDFWRAFTANQRSSLGGQGAIDMSQINLEDGSLPSEIRKLQYEDLEETILGLGQLEDQYAAITYVADEFGISTEELVERMPGLATALGSNVAAAANNQEAIERMAQAQETWAAMLDADVKELAKLTGALQQAAGAWFDYGTMIGDAWENAKIEDDSGLMVDNPDFDPAAAWTSFTTGLQTKVTDYQAFIESLSELTQRGGVNLAGEFAAIGPSAMGALTQALKMSDEDLAAVEANMRTAAFYASEEFTNAFAQSNALLAGVMAATNDPAKVAEVSKIMSDILKPGQPLTIQDIVAIEALAGIEIPISALPDLDEDALAVARLAASATPITLTTIVRGENGEPLQDTTTIWRVEEEGKILQIPVDPNTEQGQAIIAEWRRRETDDKLTIIADANTYLADDQLRQLRLRNNVMYLDVRPTFQGASINGRSIVATVRKDGGLLDGLGPHRNVNTSLNMPAFAQGGQIPKFSTGGYGKFTGPGTGTSDSILAMVSNGEYIHTARAVRYYGTEFFDAINQLKFPRYARGGSVGGAPMVAAAGGGAQVNVNVVQNYPTTQDPIRKLKEDAESVIAGIWT